ncbi:hypothetical protein AB9F29_07860 [Falsihalocynthiibacter sp. S25ZX9]|uniref:hypothetical protein n=1 Tax=Falsihalocynthiibacter sp. S25ZX9 TaxID=3240870 RepID=UPI00350F0901
MIKHILLASVISLTTPQIAAAQDQPVKKTFAQQMEESVQQQLADEEAQRLALEAAKPTAESIAADCDAQGDLAVRGLIMSQDGLPVEEAKAAILASPEGIGALEPLGASYLIEMVYTYLSKSTPEAVKARIVEQCLIR